MSLPPAPFGGSYAPLVALSRLRSCSIIDLYKRRLRGPAGEYASCGLLRRAEDARMAARAGGSGLQLVLDPAEERAMSGEGIRGRHGRIPEVVVRPVVLHGEGAGV